VRIVRKILAGIATTLAVAFTTLLGTSGQALAYPPAPPSVDTAYSELQALQVADPLPMDGYSRDRFPHWTNQHDNCNTREVVLQRDGTDVTVGSDCYPDSGKWYSVYDKVWLNEAPDVSIDHMVPLAEAWRSGAQRWDDAKRSLFANDLDHGQLIAVSISSNSSKGDQDPSKWRPGNTEVWCDYARWWIDVKYQWQLTATDAEKSALYDMMATC